MKPFVAHIIIICSRLDLPGGIERSIVNLANLFAEKGHRITLLILDETKKSFYPLQKEININLYPLNFGITDKGNMISRKATFMADIFKLKKIIKELAPEIIITTEYVFSIAAFLAGAKKYAKLYSWEHHHFNWLQKNKFWSFLFSKVYPSIDIVVCLNEKEKQLFDEAGCNTTVIPNFTPAFPCKRSLLHSKKILTIGWLINRKGADLIPAIAAVIFQKHPDWSWTIIGEGEESETLQQAIQINQLEDNIKVVDPLSPDLEKIYLNASIYVMTSRFECFPMVLLEAMSYGVPCISFDCPTGPSDIIRHEEDGLLVEKENILAMADAICRLIQNEERRKEMGAKAFENVKRFSGKKIYKLWESFL